jgi:hypothetical protein
MPGFAVLGLLRGDLAGFVPALERCFIAPPQRVGTTDRSGLDLSTGSGFYATNVSPPLLFLTSKILETLPFRPICGRIRVGHNRSG